MVERSACKKLLVYLPTNLVSGMEPSPLLKLVETPLNLVLETGSASSWKKFRGLASVAFSSVRVIGYGAS